MKINSVVCALSLAMAGQFAFATSTAEFKMRLDITLNTALADTEITTGVPALVRLSESTITGFDYDDFSLAKGGDMMFTDAAGNELPYEIDTWDPSGESLVWVRIPSTAANTVIKMYYGNGATPSAASTSVWSDYVGVWHLNDTNATDTAYSYGEYPNSTATAGINGNLADKSFADEEGKFGKSFRVNDGGFKSGNYNYGGVWVPGTDALKLGNTFTISGWFRHRAQSFYYDHIFYKRKASSNSGTPNGAFAIEVGASGNTVNKPNVRGSTSGGPTITLAGTHTDWNYLTFVFNGTTATVYENGSLKGSGAISAVTDNDAPLVFGDNTDVASGNKGDAAWGGWIDECRLMDAVPDANAIAAEYAAQNGGDSDIFTYGKATLQDATMVLFETPTLVYDGSKWTFSVTVKGGAGTANAVYEELGGSTLTNSLGSVSSGNAYTDEPTLTSGSAYAFKATGSSTAGSDSEKAGSGIVYNGAVSATKISEAEEGTLAPGVIRFSIPSALTQDLTFAYAADGTAVVGESYEELSGVATIAAGDTSVDVQIVPIFSETVASNVTVRLTVSDGSVIGGASAELTIVNFVADPYTRYVSTTGDDSNSGTALADAKATLAAAIESLDSVSADHDCTINVANGTYELLASPAGEKEWSVVLTNRISVIGLTGDPKGVTFVRGSAATGLFRVNNENAKLRYLTISGGKCGGNNGIQKGGGVYLQNGVVEDCVVSGSSAPNYGQSGVGIYVAAGRVSRCRITGGTSNNSAQNGTGVYVASGLVEDSLVDANTCGDAGSVYVKGGATFMNCTVVNNTGALTSGVRVEKATAKVVNCAIFDNTASESAHGGVYTWDYGAAYHNCASDYEIIGGDNCIVCQPRFRDAANKDYMPSAGSKLIDAGASRSTYSAVSTTDLAGNPRENGTVDIGCYENTKAVAEVALEWSANSQVLPATLSLNAASYGIDSPVYSWTLHNNDTGVDVEKSGATVSVGDLTAGTYTISVAAGSCSYTSPYTYTLSPTDLYVVSGNANAEFPYDTEAKASATIATALAAAGDAATIHVKNGTYPITTQIKLDKAVRIVGESRDGVIVTNTTKTASSRVFYMNNANAEVSTMTLAGGYSCNAGNGGNLYFSGTGGMVSNCLITAGLVQAQYNQGSGAAYMNGGVLTHCEITGCNANPSGSIECVRVITMAKKSNSAARVSNCLIHDCDCSNGGSKNQGGALINVGDYCLVDNCTIVDCVAFTNSAIVYIKAFNNSYPKSGHVVNSAIFGQDAAGSKARCAYGYNYNSAKWPQLYYNCVTEESLTDGTYEGHDCVTATPAECFTDYAGKDFSAKAGGPLVDAGAASEYALSFPSVDYLGKTRVYKTAIDIGCCEYQSSAGLIIFLR